MWTEFTCLRIGTSSGFLEHANLHFTKEGLFERKRQLECHHEQQLTHSLP